MQNRGYGHHSDLDKNLATGSETQTDFINTPKEQLEILSKKACDCPLTGIGL